MRRCLVVLVALPLCVFAEPRAPDATLVHDRRAGADACPDREALVRLVTTQLGADPFVARERARRQLKVSLRPSVQGLEAWLELSTIAGAPLGQRTLTSTGTDCRELTDALVLAISVALDPAAAALVKPAPTAPARPPPPAPPADPPTVLVAPTTEPARRWLLALGALVSWGEAPSVLPGLLVEARFRWTWLSLGGGVEVGFPMRARFELGQVTTSRFTGSVTPCAHWRWLSGCVRVAAGALTLGGERLEDAVTSTRFFATAGVRLGLDVPLGERLLLRASAETGTPLTRYTASVGGVEVWSAPWVYVHGGLGVGLRL